MKSCGRPVTHGTDGHGMARQGTGRAAAGTCRDIHACAGAISSSPLLCRRGGFAQGGVLYWGYTFALIPFALFVPLE